MKRKIKLNIDAKLLRDAQNVLEKRGIKFEMWLQLQLRSAINTQPMCFGLKDRIPFGKYNGELIESIVRADPGYMHWLVENTRRQFTDEVKQLLQELAGEAQEF